MNNVIWHIHPVNQQTRAAQKLHQKGRVDRLIRSVKEQFLSLLGYSLILGIFALGSFPASAHHEGPEPWQAPPRTEPGPR